MATAPAKKSICDAALKDAIIDLYLNVKIRSNDEVMLAYYIVNILSATLDK